MVQNGTTQRQGASMRTNRQPHFVRPCRPAETVRNVQSSKGAPVSGSVRAHQTSTGLVIRASQRHLTGLVCSQSRHEVCPELLDVLDADTQPQE